jgi:hypothetical protein
VKKMKVIQRTILKYLPGKMAETLELTEKYKAIANRLGSTTWRRYSRITGGDCIHTLIFEEEFDSFAAFGAYLDKLYADKEMAALIAKLGPITEIHEVELVSPVS